MPVDYARRIEEIRFQIRRETAAKNALGKRTEIQKKRGVLKHGEEAALHEQLNRKSLEIADMEARIRALENEQVRSKNLRRGSILK